MHADEFEALASAAVRELTSIASALQPSASTLDEPANAAGVRDAIKDAAMCLETAGLSAADLPPIRDDGTPGGFLQEARAMSSSAERERDETEAELTSLQDVRDTLLTRLAQLSEESQQEDVNRYALIDAANEREEGLRAHASELDEEARSLRDGLDASYRQLHSLGGLRHALGLRQRTLQRRRDDSEAVKNTASEVLGRQVDAEAYVEATRARRAEMEQMKDKSEKQSAVHMDTYNRSWEDRRNMCQDEVKELEDRLTQASTEHDDHYKAIEADRTGKLKELEAKFAEYAAQHECALQEIEDSRNNELAGSQDQQGINASSVERLEASVVADLEARLRERQQILNEALEAERHECEARRSQQQRRINLLRDEAGHFGGLLSEVRRCYSGSYRRGPLGDGPSPASTTRCSSTFGTSHGGSAPLSPRSEMFLSPVPSTPGRMQVASPQAKKFSRQRYGHLAPVSP